MKTTFIITVFTVFSIPIEASSLIDIVNIAIDNNLSLKSAKKDYEANRYDIDIHRSKFLPSLSLNADTTWNENKEFQTTDQHITNDYNSNSYSLSLSQNIFNLNDIYTIKSTQIDVDISHLQTVQTEQEVIKQAATKYFDFLKNRSQIKATESEFSSSKSRFKKMQRNIQLGNTAKNEIYEVIAQKENIRNKLFTLKKERQVILNDLNNILQINKTPTFDLNKLTTFPQIKEPKKIFLKNAMYELNTSILISKKQLNQSKQNIRETQAEFSPTLTGDVSYRKDNSNNPSSNSPPDFGINESIVYSLNFHLPLSTGGSDLYTYRKNKIGYEKTHLDLIKSGEDSLQSFNNYIANINDFSRSLDSYSLIIKANYASYNGIKKAHKLGTRTITDLLSAESKLFNSIRDYESARYNYIIEIINLNKTVGLLNTHSIKSIMNDMVPLTDDLSSSPIPLHLIK
ncbi:TolC family protein [Shewanella surugensis]|uniref:TolC family protein n=1 Tax=Shewanella surugensis TaxID=212020 RepID=A0ABT0L985_9GAMM|nr:TolC family protein [Shewanella surugensis]MCL1124264.1 TolC family protein [Shewanella surugensis]